MFKEGLLEEVRLDDVKPRAVLMLGECAFQASKSCVVCLGNEVSVARVMNGGHQRGGEKQIIEGPNRPG